MTSSMSVPICKRFHARQANSKKTLLGRYPCLTPACAGLVKRRGSKLGLLKSIFNDKNFVCRLSWSISSHFGAIHCWNVYISPKSKTKSLKPLILGVQSHSRSSVFTALRSSSLVLVIISSMSVPIYTVSQKNVPLCHGPYRRQKLTDFQIFLLAHLLDN